MTKKQMMMYENWERATMYDIYDAYERPSAAKVYAYNKCIQDFCKLNGTAFRLCTKNTFGFTCAFLFIDGDDVMMYYATKDNKYIFNVNERWGK